MGTMSVLKKLACLTVIGCTMPPIAFAIGDYGPDTCAEGFVWREACGPTDHVCVTPDIRSQAQQDNQLASHRRKPGGGTYGPDTCLQGFVWREACGAQDHVCVPPATHARAADDNRHAGERLKYPVCQNYAQEAVNANRRNIANHCGFSGGRWQDNFDEHFRWCLNVSNDAIMSETAVRRQQLESCTRPTTCAHCNDGSCQCGAGTPDQLCAGHGGNNPSIGCTQQP